MSLFRLKHFCTMSKRFSDVYKLQQYNLCYSFSLALPFKIAFNITSAKPPPTHVSLISLLRSYCYFLDPGNLCLLISNLYSCLNHTKHLRNLCWPLYHWCYLCRTSVWALPSDVISSLFVCRQVLSTFLCFFYILYWHGVEFHLLLWCVLNLGEVSLELLGGRVEVKVGLFRSLRPSNQRRVRAAASVPLFLMSVFAIFYFFGKRLSGKVFMDRLLIEIPWPSFGLFLFLVYCAIQNAIEVERLGVTKLAWRPYLLTHWQSKRPAEPYGKRKLIMSFLLHLLIILTSLYLFISLTWV